MLIFLFFGDDAHHGQETISVNFRIKKKEINIISHSNASQVCVGLNENCLVQLLLFDFLFKSSSKNKFRCTQYECLFIISHHSLTLYDFTLDQVESQLRAR